MATRDLPLTFASSSSASLRTPSLPPGLSLLVLDSLSSPGTFLLVHFIGKALKPVSGSAGTGKGEGKRPVVLVSLAEGESGWEGLLKKQGIQVAPERTRSFFTFLDARSYLRPPPSPSSQNSPSPLEGLAKSIEEAVARLDATEPPLVVVDDLTSLLWAGYAVVEVLEFHTALRRLQGDTKASLLLTFHADLTTSSNASSAVEGPDQAVLTSLIHLSDVIVRTKSLGRSDAGEYAVFRGPAYLDDPDLPTTKNGITIQYRLNDTSVSYVTKGLDRDFL